MERYSRFQLRPFLRTDLARQWLLLKSGSGQPPKTIRLWLGLVSPRFVPVLLCRLAHWFFLMRLLPVAKLISFINFFLFGIEIAVRCPIGPGLFFPHTQGTVIGAWQIGANATIFQGVTLGAKEVDFSYAEAGRPMIGDGVTIGAGAKVLGGVSIGDGVSVGANSVVLDSIPSGSLAVGVPARVVKSKGA